MKRLLLATVGVLLIAAAGGGAWWARQSLPPVDGELALSGLSDPLEVIFDGYGVPHVYARDPEGAWFAAGVMHARDRLWQMELYRRVTAGRLSEIMGADTLPIDKRFLTLRLRAAAEAEWQRAQPEVRSALEQYSAGVNAVVSRLVPRQRPLEMQVLGLMPAAWTPVDSLAVARLLAWRLAENHQAELVRAAVAASLGTDAARQLAGRYPADAPTILGEPSRGFTEPSSASRPADAEGPPSTLARAQGAWPPGPAETSWPAGLEWLRPMAPRGNSNNWVLSGQRTATGRPLLANDPHLLVEFPSVFYEMHLVAANLDVIGVTVPGLPFVVIGHNRRIAWGFTNSGADVQDLYLERIDVARRRYQAAGGWQPATVTPIEIPVRGRGPEAFEIWETARGPVHAEPTLDWEAPPAWMSPASRSGDVVGQVSAYTLRWEGIDGDMALGLERLNRAHDWDTFGAAVDTLDSPSQNIVYADVDGNIGYALNGRLPTRVSGDGTMPMPASGGAGWADGAPRPALPRVLNPSDGYLTSSNNEIDRRLGGLIARDWAAPFRTTRLHEQLSTARGVSMDEMAALQNDTTSLSAARVLAGVAGALDAAKEQKAEAAAIQTLTELAAWDRVVDGRPIVTLYQAFEDALWRRTFADEMPEALYRVFYQWAGADRPSGLYAVIDDRQSRWFDDIATVDRRESRDDVFVLAARDAAERVAAEFGSGGGRAWDRVHAVTFAHPLASGSRLLAWAFSRGPVPVTGDGSTVMRISWNRLRPFAAWEAPSWRALVDVGAWDDTRVALPTGQSGHPLSPHHFDQNELWRSGRYRTQPFSRDAVLAAQAHRLLLVP